VKEADDDAGKREAYLGTLIPNDLPSNTISNPTGLAKP